MTDLDVEKFERSCAWIRSQMIGYWIMPRGFRVTFEKPTRQERFIRWFYGDYWVAYDKGEPKP